MVQKELALRKQSTDCDASEPQIPNLRQTKNILFWLLSALAVSLLCLSASPAISRAQNAQDIQWRVFSKEDGLISNDVWTLLAVDDAIWIGTDQGIARYDGTWSRYYNEDNRSNSDELTSDIQRGHIVALADASREGEIWAGSGSGEIAWWDGNRWRAAFHLPVPISALYDAAGRLLIGTSQGVWQVSPDETTPSPLANSVGLNVTALEPDDDAIWIGSTDGVWRLTDVDLTPVPMDEGVGDRRIDDLWLDSAGVLWVAKADGVTWYDTRVERWSETLLPVTDPQGTANPILALAGDDTGTVWAGSNGAGARKFIDYGLATIDVARTSGGGLTTPFVFDIAVDQDGSIWFATPVGLFQFQERIWFMDYLDQDDIPQTLNEVNDLLIDGDNSLWVATAGAGIRRKEPGRIGYSEQIFNTENSAIANDAVLALAEDRDGRIWAGTMQGLTRSANDEWALPFDARELPSLLVTALFADDAGIWIGTDAGLVFWDLTTETLTPFESFDGMTVEALTKDSSDRLWVGTRADGVWVQNRDGRWIQHVFDRNAPQSFPGSGVVANGLAVNHVHDGVWALVANGGLVYWDGQGWHDGDPQNKLPSGLLYRLYVDRQDGSLWVGTEAGVARYDGQTWGLLHVEDGLQSTAIYAMAQDQEDGYWFGGPDGLTRYWPEASAPWVRFASFDGAQASGNGTYTARVGTPVEISLEYGDLQTPQAKIELFYRLDGESSWQELNSDSLQLNPSEVGPQEVQVMARDLAFNYSEIMRQEIAFLMPPRTASLPLLGEVETGVFWTLILLGGTALLGFAYVSLEIVQNRRQTNDAVNRGYNPYVSGEPVRNAEMFFARHNLLQRIVDTLHNNSIMIHGERRIGKTTLLYQLANTLQTVEDDDYWFVPIYADLEGTPEDSFFHFLMEEIVQGVNRLPDAQTYLAQTPVQLRLDEVPAKEYRDRDFSNDIRAVIDTLDEYGESFHPHKQLRLILLLDEMDVMSGYDRLVQQQLRRIFMRDFSSTLGAVVAGIQINKEWDRVESPWYNLFNEIEVEPFTREDGIDLLLEPVRNIYRYDTAAVAYILDRCDGRPFRIQQYGLESVNHMLAQGRRKVRLEDAEAAHERIQNSYVAEHETIGLRTHSSEEKGTGASDSLTESASITEADLEPSTAADLAVTINADGK